MPVRPPAPCRRTVPQVQATTLASHTTGIWITDAMLRRGFERYRERCHGQSSWAPSCRRLSSHSGPLESRRRLGKRNMAALMPSTPIHPPLWHFEVISIPDSWKWEPPSTKDERRRRGKSLSIAGLFNRFMGWLEKSDADKPFIQPPSPLDPLDMAQTVVGEAAAALGSITGDGIAPKIYEHPIDYPKEVLQLRKNIALVEEMDDDLLYRLCRTCRRSLQRRIIRRHLSVEGLYLALEPFDRGTMGLLPDHKLAGKFAAMIRRTVLAAMEDVQKEDPHAPFEHLWLAFAAWLCASGGGHSNMQLFWRLMHAMPESLRARIPSDQLFEIVRAFISGQADRHNIFTHWIARTKNFGEIYDKLSAAQRDRTRADVDSFLAREEEADELSERSKRMRFSWLAVQAYDKSISNEEFIISYRHLISSRGFRLGHLQLWQLILGRAKSMGLDKETHSQLMAMVDSPPTTQRFSTSQRWSALLNAISNSTSIKAGLKAFCECFKEIGEMDTIVDALLSARPQFIRVDCLQALAVACDDYRFALQLHEALKAKSVSDNLLRKHFNWEFWAPFVRDMIMDEELESAPIGRLLQISRHNLQQSGNDANADNLLVQQVTAKVELLDKMGHWYMETTHLTDRQLLRRIGECVTIQRSLINSVTDKTLANLTQVIVRDLEKGQWGRTTRLEWLLRLIAELQGEKKAASAASALKGWRYMINQANGRSSV